MLRSWLAAHAYKTALAGALLSAVLFFMFMATWIVSIELRQVSGRLDAAALRIKDVRDTVVDTLRFLDKNVAPVCSADNLFELRRRQFRTRYLGDIGVFDAEGRLTCTAVAGVLKVPIIVQPPDLNQPSTQGDVFGVNYRANPLAIGGRERSTIIRHGRFNVVISPYATRDIIHAGIDALQLVTPTGQASTVVYQDSLGGEWIDRLSTAEFSVGGLRRVLWNERAFVASESVAGTFYVAQSVVTFDAFARKYQRFLLACLFLSTLIGVLMYQLLKIRLLRWRDLRYSIEQLLNEKQILCVYQPIVDLKTLETVGCEVLMRLRRGNKILPPDQVIPAVVSQGLTWKLDQLVVRKAMCEINAKLPATGEFKVAFNFFPDNVTGDKISGLFADIDPDQSQRRHWIEIEVLEQDYAGGQIVAEVTQLRQRGFLFSVDDFGTGYSNLRTIKAISPDFLKIDRSFVFDMEDSSIRSSLIPEIVGIARAVGAQVIAEGIENEHQLKILREMGVEFGQGYYFAKPVPINDFAAYLDASLRARTEQQRESN